MYYKYIYLHKYINISIFYIDNVQNIEYRICEMLSYHIIITTT